MQAELDAIMERIPTVARLYYTGRGARRYRRASVMNGPGEPLVHRSHVEQELRRLLASRIDGVAVADAHASVGQPLMKKTGVPVPEEHDLLYRWWQVQIKANALEVTVASNRTEFVVRDANTKQELARDPRLSEIEAFLCNHSLAVRLQALNEKKPGGAR